uniref:Uncharacterized protein n=1 Tax=Fagus sylvatica TaxID=28930 RepID=A0A2N9FXX5_FAGSY
MNGGFFQASKLRQALVSLETRASKHPIEQPPQPLDRLSLDLQNPERSSSLEAPRALTRHWSSRLSCPRATTRPSHHDLRNHSSKHLLGSRPPPTDRSSSDLSLYGGKNSNGEDTRSHALEKKPATLFTRSSAAARFEAQIEGLPSSD